MSKRFATFPDGNPPLDTDLFLFARADGSVNGYSDYTLTWAELKAAVGVPSTTSFFLLNDGVSFFLLNDGVSKLQMNS